jgi:hypothetical protein
MKNSEEKPWLRPGKKPFKPKALPKKEREGVQRLAASIDDTFSHINKKTDIERDVERLNNSHRKSNKIARAIVGGIYDLYLYYQSDTSKHLFGLPQPWIYPRSSPGTRLEIYVRRQQESAYVVTPPLPGRRLGKGCLSGS